MERKIKKTDNSKYLMMAIPVCKVKSSPAIKTGAALKKAIVKNNGKFKVAAKKWL